MGKLHFCGYFDFVILLHSRNSHKFRAHQNNILFTPVHIVELLSCDQGCLNKLKEELELKLYVVGICCIVIVLIQVQLASF